MADCLPMEWLSRGGAEDRRSQVGDDADLSYLAQRNPCAPLKVVV